MVDDSYDICGKGLADTGNYVGGPAAKGWGIIEQRLHPQHDGNGVISHYSDVPPLTGAADCGCHGCIRAASRDVWRQERLLRRLADRAHLAVTEVPTRPWPAIKFCQSYGAAPPKEGTFNKYGGEGPSGMFGGPPLGAAVDAGGHFGDAASGSSSASPSVGGAFNEYGREGPWPPGSDGAPPSAPAASGPSSSAAPSSLVVAAAGCGPSHQNGIRIMDSPRTRDCLLYTSPSPRD